MPAKRTPVPEVGAGHAAVVQRVLASQTFRQVARLKRFLEFITAEAMAGRGGELKEYVIGVQVFDKEQSFDPRADPIVRVQARRLRARLERYYREEGATDETVIDLAKGGYAPAFRARVQAPAGRIVAPSGSPQNTVAVDTIADQSDTGSLKGTAEGLRTEIVHALTQSRGPRVLTRRAQAAADIGGAGAAWKVAGSVRQSGDTIRLTANVINGVTGSYIASESVDATAATLISAQETLAAFVVRTIRPKALESVDGRPGARPSENLAARNLYLQGRYHLAQRTETGLVRAVEFFQGALIEDPQYALAHSGLSDAYGLLTNYGVRGPADVWAKAASHATTGVALDPLSVETRTTLAHVRATQEWDWPAAEREFQAAIQLSPEYAYARHWYAMSCLVPLGRIDEAMQEVLLAQSLDPVSSIVARDVAALHLFRRDLDAALEQCDHAIGVNPHFAPAYLTLSLIQEQRHELDEAIAALHRAIDLTPNSPRTQAALARTLALSGKREQATTMLKTLEELTRHRYVSPYDVACVRFALGQEDLGFRGLTRAVKDRCFELLSLRYDPRMDIVRGDRRLDAIAGKIGVQ